MENMDLGHRHPPLHAVSHPWSAGHDVRFIDGDTSLVSAVSDFLADGIRATQPIIVIATPEHRRGIVARLQRKGLDPDVLHPSDSVWLDARETLSAFMEGPMPDADLFMATVGNVFEKVLLNRRYLMVRAYGEMVDLLWREGKADGAIALENMWNDLAQRYSFSLLCTYSRDSLMAHCPESGIERICAAHQRVL
jgi:hypothetical protein